MSGQLFTSLQLDADGRQFITQDNIIDVHYYTTENEVWDRTGAGTSSWYLETSLPHDLFDSDSLLSDRWAFSGDADNYTLEQVDNTIAFGVERSEGSASVSSDGKWRLSGNFDIRIYFDWNSYYNEYRSISHTFLKVGVDNKNAVRVSLAFDGEADFQFSSEKTVDRDLRFFDWKENGTPTPLSSIGAAKEFEYVRITRIAGVIVTSIVNGDDVRVVGDAVTDAVFSDDVFVEFGIEAKEYNTLRSSFTKFFVNKGTLSGTTEFFSSARGRRQDFPERSIITVDSESLSIIDEDRELLWSRFLFEDSSVFPDSDIKTSACNGVVYCATTAGLVALDFVKDRIYKYTDTRLLESVEPLALRNATLDFNDVGGIGSFPSSSFNDVTCKTIGTEDFIAVTSSAGVSVIRALASGIGHSTDGPLPATNVEISEGNRLWWSGYDAPNNLGELSSFDALASLTEDVSFSRDTFYSPDTVLPIFGANIQAFNILTVNGADLISVGTSEGLSFIGFSPGTPATAATSFGVVAPAANPFADPSFEKYIGLDWLPFTADGFHTKFKIYRSDEFSTNGGSYSLKLRFDDRGLNPIYQEGTRFGVYQDVDLTGVSAIYFDTKIVKSIFASDVWDFQLLLGDAVIKSYTSGDGPFEKLNDFATIPEGTSGVQRVTFQLRMRYTNSGDGIGGTLFYVDNIKTKIGDPEYRILPVGAASINEVLLQYDDSGHKLYFSSLAGYGALDLDDVSLDYFVPITVRVPDATIQSADFARIDNEV